MSDFVASPERLVTGALLGFAVLLFLIIKVKVQPFIAIMSSALIIGLVVGMPFDMITDTLAEGVGTTLQTIAILIGLGSMFGAILQVSGGVEVIADTLLKVFGEKNRKIRILLFHPAAGRPCNWSRLCTANTRTGTGSRDVKCRTQLCYHSWNYHWNTGYDPGRTCIWKIRGK